MNNIIQTPHDVERVEKILGKKLPWYRKAYSDREAWLMACMSELAYTRFNSCPVSVQGCEKILKKLHNSSAKFLKKAKAGKNIVKYEKTIQTAFSLLEDKLLYDYKKEMENLEKELAILGFKLHKTFDREGTQAFLAYNEESAVLAFRGTELTSYKDIETDLKATLVRCESGGKVHQGFKEAYEQVALDIDKAINDDEIRDKPLFITGHSLGGALASIAAKEINIRKGGIGNAACYTFGSPRVGNEKWVSNMKTPIYRIVNSADSVPLLPPSGDFWSIIGYIVRFFAKYIFRVPIPTEIPWIEKISGYMHVGNMRFLTNCKLEDYSNVQILYSVTLWRRIVSRFSKIWKNLIKDHSIDIYRKKLLVIAERRNKEK